MPISSPKGKDIIKNWFANQTDIKTIIDLGPGKGSYPKLLGVDKYIWKAVEIWGPYIKLFNLDKIYEEIRIGDIQYMELPDGDCAILGDVLEHIEKEGAIKTFKKVDKQFRHVIVSIPLNSAPGRYNRLSTKAAKFVKMVETRNNFEKHISIWTLEELNELIPDTYKIREVISPIAIFIK